MKKWHIAQTTQSAHIVDLLLKNRGLTEGKDIEIFLHPPDPYLLKADDVGIDKNALAIAVQRVRRAIDAKESIVVYADYDADGITAGTIMWETLHSLGAKVMPYIPHRVEEGYGLSKKGIDAIKEQYNPSLVVTVDHGITAWEKVDYAKELGIEVMITDHHVKPEKLPDCTIVHTTQLCGAGVSWFVAKELSPVHSPELLALATIGTIADMVPLFGPNRSIVKYGLAALNKTTRVGLRALIDEAGLTLGELKTYDVSHALAPRLNAMGRLVHAMDALRLLCTKQEGKARLLAQKLALTNKERQTMTMDMSLHAKEFVNTKLKTLSTKLLFVAHESYNQGVIGLVAGKLVEEFYRPSIVLAKGELISKASARSIAGFNIVEAIRSCSDILIDVGGHPMAAGFTVETKNLPELQRRLEELAEKELDEEKLTRVLRVDAEIPLELASEKLWMEICDFAPFGLGNLEPVFVSRDVVVQDSRLVGNGGKHVKLRVSGFDAIAFGFGNLYGELKRNTPIDIAFALDMNIWNGNRALQLKIKDIHISS